MCHPYVEHSSTVHIHGPGLSPPDDVIWRSECIWTKAASLFHVLAGECPIVEMGCSQVPVVDGTQVDFRCFIVGRSLPLHGMTA